MSMPRWRFWDREFPSPIILASGTAGFGLELARMGCLEGVAAIVSKATTLEPREGNPPPRIVETRFGLLNSIGLANPGVDAILVKVLPEAAELPCPLIVNVAGRTAEEFRSVVERLEESPVPFGYEVNVSCPNVDAGGAAFGADPGTVGRVTALVRSATERPFSVKLTPNEGSLTLAAAAAEGSGADGITVCNTFLGMRLDWRTGDPILGRGAGGYSSPALLPLTVARVHSVSRTVRVPVMASGGVSRGEDVLELLAAGASMVQVGTLVMRRPGAPAELMEEISTMLAEG